MPKRAHELTLAEAIDLLVYGASCEKCHEVRRIDLHKLLADLGPEFVVGYIRPRLICGNCGGRDLISVTLWQSATTTTELMRTWKG